MSLAACRSGGPSCNKGPAPAPAPPEHHPRCKRAGHNTKARTTTANRAGRHRPTLRPKPPKTPAGRRRAKKRHEPERPRGTRRVTTPPTSAAQQTLSKPQPKTKTERTARPSKRPRPSQPDGQTRPQRRQPQGGGAQREATEPPSNRPTNEKPHHCPISRKQTKEFLLCQNHMSSYACV